MEHISTCAKLRTGHVHYRGTDRIDHGILRQI